MSYHAAVNIAVIVLTIIYNDYSSNHKCNTNTAQNTVISPCFLMWTLGEIAVFYAWQVFSLLWNATRNIEWL